MCDLCTSVPATDGDDDDAVGSCSTCVLRDDQAKIFVSGSAYPDVADGEYTAGALEYNGRPIYTKVTEASNDLSRGSTSVYLYSRSDGHWYLNIQGVWEEWDGTINWALAESDEPYEARWNQGETQAKVGAAQALNPQRARAEESHRYV